MWFNKMLEPIPMGNFDASSLFEQLLARFEEAGLETHDLIVPPGYDGCVLFAIIGRAYFSTTEELESDFYVLVQRHRGRGTKASQSFSCLAVGALLGLRESNRIDESTLRLALDQLPAFIDAHSSEIEG